MSAIMACRLYQYLTKIEEYKDLNVYFWTDSRVVLTWIKTKSNWNVFVNNRVAEIRSSSDINNWNRVPGDINPADIPSRGCNSKVLLETQWWMGPEWLKKNRVLAHKIRRF